MKSKEVKWLIIMEEKRGKGKRRERKGSGTEEENGLRERKT